MNQAGTDTPERAYQEILRSVRTQDWRAAEQGCTALISGHPRWAEQIMFRDALRRDRALAQRYEDLKLRLARQHGHDREAYSEGKAQFVAAVLAQPSHPEARATR